MSLGTTELAPGVETTPLGTVAFPPQAEVAKSAPAVSISTRLLKVGIPNLAPNVVVYEAAFEVCLSLPASLSDRFPLFKREWRRENN
jgi:hypothetical protein